MGLPATTAAVTARRPDDLKRDVTQAKAAIQKRSML
jgi:hypothetical protein